MEVFTRGNRNCFASVSFVNGFDEYDDGKQAIIDAEWYTFITRGDLIRKYSILV